MTTGGCVNVAGAKSVLCTSGTATYFNFATQACEAPVTCPDGWTYEPATNSCAAPPVDCSQYVGQKISIFEAPEDVHCTQGCEFVYVDHTGGPSLVVTATGAKTVNRIYQTTDEGTGNVCPQGAPSPVEPTDPFVPPDPTETPQPTTAPEPLPTQEGPSTDKNQVVMQQQLQAIGENAGKQV